jgi:catechol 2,3-dioxygenase-like lactoylglutathione lyase family enzyme
MTATEPPAINQLLWPVPDIDAALAFYVDALGMTLAFRDADRFAAVRAGGVTLALVSGTEDVTAGVPAPACLVADLASSVATAEAAGAEIVVRAQEGPHEVRAVLRDPSGHFVVLYQRR